MSWGIFGLLLWRRNDLCGSLDWSRRFFFPFGCCCEDVGICEFWGGFFNAFPPPLPLVNPRCPFYVLDLL